LVAGLAINLVLDLFQNAGRDILDHILGVKREHPNLTLPCTQKIDDSDAAVLAAASDTPAKFADATRARNYHASFRIGKQRLLKLCVFVIRQILLHESREQLGFNEADHASIIRQRRTTSIRVLELEALGPVPFCEMLLADASSTRARFRNDFGAEVFQQLLEFRGRQDDRPRRRAQSIPQWCRVDLRSHPSWSGGRTPS
jgi:hypothetical protein